MSLRPLSPTKTRPMLSHVKVGERTKELLAPTGPGGGRQMRSPGVPR
jgi:hypothetical protein